MGKLNKAYRAKQMQLSLAKQQAILAQVKKLAPNCMGMGAAYAGKWQAGNYVAACNIIKANFGGLNSPAISQHLCLILEWCSLDCCYNGWE